MKFFRFQIVAFFVLTLAVIQVATAQDTTRRARPVAAKPTATRVAQPSTYKRPTGTPATQPAAGTAVIPRPVIQQPAAQNTGLLTDKSLNGQYRYLLTRVYNYQQPLISALWKNVSDTLKTTRNQLKDARAKLAAQTQKADTLQSQISQKDQSLSASNARMDTVSLLGMPVTKSTYNWIMWGLVVGFGVIAAVIVARSGAYSREAKYRTKLYEELEEEYKTYKVKANEKEKKLARELQTERNKLEELRGNA